MNNDQNRENDPQLQLFFRWFPMLEIFSMDCMSEFGNEFGLQSAELNPMKAICRDFVRDYYDNKNSLDVLLSQALESLRQLLGEDTIGQLGRNNYSNYHEQNTQARDWVILFGRLSEYFHVEDYPLVPLNLSNEKIMLLRIAFLAYIAKVNRFRLRICEIKHTPMSHWDTYVYSKHSGKTDPVVWLENQIVFNYKVAQWNQIQEFLTAPNDVQTLEEWGIQQAKIMQQDSPTFVRF